MLFPFRIGAATIQLEAAPPDVLLPAIAKYRATICFTAPTAYRAMLGKLAEHDISSLRKCVSAGETLPKATFEAWQKATGMKILDGIGATEMMHIFIGSPEREIRAGATGKAVPGYEAKVIDDEGRECRARHRRPPRGARADRLPLSRGRAADEIRAERLERHRRHLRDGCRRLLLVSGALRRHDHLGGLQHRGAGSGIRAADCIRRSPNAAWSASPTRSAARS